MGLSASKTKEAQGSDEKSADEVVFSQQEAGFLDIIFQELAHRSSTDTIDKSTFLQLFEDIPGVLGDRLFNVIDKDKSGSIDMQEFLEGYKRFVSSSRETKMNILFELFDLDGDREIEREELELALLSIVTPPNIVLQASSRQLDIPFTADDDDSKDRGPPIKRQHTREVSFENEGAMKNALPKVKKWVDHAFLECDVDGSRTLDPKEFRTWLSSNDQLLVELDKLFLQLAWKLPDPSAKIKSYSMVDAEAQSRRYFKPEWAKNARLWCPDCKVVLVTTLDRISQPKPTATEEKTGCDYLMLSFAKDQKRNKELKHCMKCGKQLSERVEEKPTSVEHAISSKDDHEGFVNMPGKNKFNPFVTWWLKLHGKFLYLYKNKDSSSPEEVTFVQGYIMELISYKENTGRGSNPLTHLVKVIPPLGATNSKLLMLYFTNEQDAETWRYKLEKAAQTVNIKKYYDFKDELGSGSFAKVYKAIDKKRNKTVAVKEIAKKFIDGKQKEYIRVEMSILKIARHPNVCKCLGVFENRTHIYMIMPLAEGGNLYEYIKAEAAMGIEEEVAKKIIWCCMSAIEYLHTLGIVHRDLKLQNLLLKRGSDPTDIVLTDFGLSKFATPHEAMKAACGTVEFVAPEVLRQKGYGKEVDIWSIGVILFAILAVTLPFLGKKKSETIQMILYQKVKFDYRWDEVSKTGRSFVKRLLTKDPSKRIKADEALKHPWFDSVRSEMDKDNTTEMKKDKSAPRETPVQMLRRTSTLTVL